MREKEGRTDIFLFLKLFALMLQWFRFDLCTAPIAKIHPVCLQLLCGGYTHLPPTSARSQRCSPYSMRIGHRLVLRGTKQSCISLGVSLEGEFD